MVRSRFVAAFRARPAHWGALLLFGVLGAVFYGPFLERLPEGLHAWAQADRLALALNFYDFGFDFWHPRTSSFTSIGGVTGVEFPLQPYLAALGGRVLGRGAISPLFRLIDVAVTVLGFWYLFRIVFERTSNFILAVLPGAFLLASPTYAFYAGTYLPDPISLSITFIGYYYWLRFFDARQFRYLLVAIALLTLASLLKTTSGLHLAAVVAITILWACQEPALLSARQRRWLLATVAVAFSSLVLFMRHNQGLNDTYASLQFLAELRPITDIDTAHSVLTFLRRDWLPEYATIAMYWLLVGCALLAVVFVRANLRRAHLPLTLLLVASVAISYLFFKLMGAQFSVHDYYIICSFGPPAVLVLVLALLNLGRYQGAARLVISLGLGVLLVLFVGSGLKRLHRRYSDEYLPFSLYYTHGWMRGGAAQLRQLAVPATARVLVLDDPAPNLSLVYFDRRGLSWKPELNGLHSNSLLEKMAGDSLNYLIMSPAAYAKLATEHTAMATDFALLGEKPAVVMRRRNLSYPW